MKKTTIVLAAFLVTALTACSGSNSSENTVTKDTATNDVMLISGVKYTCKMHPEIISDTPGHCPKCGMVLIKMKDTMMNMNHDSMPMARDSMKKH